jgi:hypothetical protein
VRQNNPHRSFVPFSKFDHNGPHNGSHRVIYLASSASVRNHLGYTLPAGDTLFARSKGIYGVENAQLLS